MEVSMWVPIDERTPESTCIKRYKVKMIIGGISKREDERFVLGRMTTNGFRFMVGDWQKVTHWWNE